MFRMPPGLPAGQATIEVPYGNGQVARGTIIVLPAALIGGSTEAAVDRLLTNITELADGVASRLAQMQETNSESPAVASLTTYHDFVNELAIHIAGLSAGAADTLAALYSANPSAVDQTFTDFLSLAGSVRPQRTGVSTFSLQDDEDPDPVALCIDGLNRLSAADELVDRLEYLGWLSVAAGVANPALGLATGGLVAITMIPALTIQDHLQGAPFVFHPAGLRVLVEPGRLNHLNTAWVSAQIERRSMQQIQGDPVFASLNDELQLLTDVRLAMLEASSKLGAVAKTVGLDAIMSVITELIASGSADLLYQEMIPLTEIGLNHLQMDRSGESWQMSGASGDRVRQIETYAIAGDSMIVQLPAQVDGLYPECSASTLGSDEAPSEGRNGFVVLGPGSVNRIEAEPQSVTLSLSDMADVMLVAYTDLGAIRAEFETLFEPVGFADVIGLHETSVPGARAVLRGSAVGTTQLTVAILGETRPPTIDVPVEITPPLAPGRFYLRYVNGQTLPARVYDLVGCSWREYPAESNYFDFRADGTFTYVQRWILGNQIYSPDTGVCQLYGEVSESNYSGEGRYEVVDGIIRLIGSWNQTFSDGVLRVIHEGPGPWPEYRGTVTHDYSK